MLGYLDAGFFLGGAMALDRAAAETAIRDGVAKPLGVEALRAAWGIHEIVSEDVARAFRIHASERGFDYRSGSMVAFGGSRAAACARHRPEAQDPARDLPVGAGVMSALGLLISPLAFEMARSRRIHVADIDAADFTATFAALEARGDVVPAERRRRQGRHPPEAPARHALPGPGPRDRGDAAGRRGRGALFARLGELFDRAYEAGLHAAPRRAGRDRQLEGRGGGPAPNLGAGYRLSGLPERQGAEGRRLAYDPRGRADDGVAGLRPLRAFARRAQSTGPALIEERESTCVIGAGQTATVDAHYNLVADLIVTGMHGHEH